MRSLSGYADRFLNRVIHILNPTHHDNQAAAYEQHADEHLDEHAIKQRTYVKKAHVMANELVRRFGPRCSILEVGCGGGFFTASLASLLPDCDIVATDVFPAVIEAARRRLRPFSHASAMPFSEFDSAAPPHADAVLGVDVIHHLEDPVASLARWRKLVRPGGAALFLEANPANPALFLRSIGRPEERRFFLNSPGRLRRWLSEAGWEAEEVENLPFYLPSGPPSLASILDHADGVLHLGRPIWGRLSGLFWVRGSNALHPG